MGKYNLFVIKDCNQESFGCRKVAHWDVINEMVNQGSLMKVFGFCEKITFKKYCVSLCVLIMKSSHIRYILCPCSNSEKLMVT